MIVDHPVMSGLVILPACILEIVTVLFVSKPFAASAFPINIALNENSQYCFKDDILTEMTDGVKSITKGFRTDERCPGNSYVTIEFSNSYYIHYVVVYEDTPIVSGTKVGQLDYFRVLVKRNDMAVLCSLFPSPSIGAIPNVGMRVNCRDVTIAFNTLQIHSQVSIGLNIVEIEAYTFALLPPDDKIWIPRGCYSKIESHSSFRLQSWKHCKAECRWRDLAFAAIKNNEECHCVLKLEESDHRPLGECVIRCDGSEYLCGGRRRYSVYIVNLELPKYIGCFSFDRDNRFLVVTLENLTPGLCLNRCEKNSSVLLTRGNMCICEKRYDELHLTASRDPRFCDMRCSGDPESFCGGIDYVSVYTSCIGSAPQTTCSTFFRCSSNKIDRYGVCIDGCQKSFIGEHCLERRSLVSESEATGANSICSVYQPCNIVNNSECTDVGGYYDCECKDGFESVEGDCREIGKAPDHAIDPDYPLEPHYKDEDGDSEAPGGGGGGGGGGDDVVVTCPKDLCNNETSTCVISDGAFYCQCIRGHAGLINRCIDLKIIITVFGSAFMIALGLMVSKMKQLQPI